MTTWWSAITTTLAVIGHAKVTFVVAALATDTLSLVLMAFRWRLLLRALGSGATLWESLLACSAGVCVSNITPARTAGGDACRAALIRRPDGTPSVAAMAASVVYDRASDLPGLFLLVLLALPLLEPTRPLQVLLMLIALAVGLFARPLHRLVSRKMFPRRSATVDGVGVAAGMAVGCSLVIWPLDVTRILLVGWALGVALTPSQAATISLLRLGSGLVPVPAGIGVVDGALVAGFMWLGLPATTAAAAVVVERAIVYGWGTALGAAALVLLGGVRALTRVRAGTDVSARDAG